MADIYHWCCATGRKEHISVLFLFFITACSQLQTPDSNFNCSTLTTWNGSECCQDFDSNKICDNKDTTVLEKVSQMTAEKQNKPTPATAVKIVRKPTIITESIAKIKFVKSYEYFVNNYHYFVAGNTIKLYLPVSINIGKLESENFSYPAIINKITFDRNTRTAFGECITPLEFIKYALANPCDKLTEKKFELNYADYATFKIPEDLLYEFESEYPFEVQEKQHLGKRLATLAVFRKNRQNQSLLWIDTLNGLPLKHQRIENGEPVETLEFLDLFVNNTQI
ncbi:MAG: hypothetical protein HY363_02560 [Candidatus Aenigmarchaeota archaeon]|nr:hypothetical protein [Candidatus Aenigmarchaeota archaeon]